MRRPVSKKSGVRATDGAQGRQELVLSVGAGLSGAPRISLRLLPVPSPPRTLLDRMHGRDSDAGKLRTWLDADSRARRPHAQSNREQRTNVAVMVLGVGCERGHFSMAPLLAVGVSMSQMAS